MFPIPLAEGHDLKSTIVKRSVVIHGHKTSISLEEPFWVGLKVIAEGQSISLSEMIGGIDKSRVAGNLSSALRLFVYGNVCAQVAATSADKVSELAAKLSA